MTAPSRPTRKRDPARSRAAILDAAETLFADHGYEGVTVAMIGEAAGVSHATPNYFFGAKANLYVEVIARLRDVREEFLRGSFDAALARLSESPSSPEALRSAVEEAVERYVSFMVHRPTFVKLLQREGLDGAHRLAARPAATLPVNAFVMSLLETLAPGRVSRDEADRVAMTFVALTFFPFAQAAPLRQGVGFDPLAPAFLRVWRARVVDLLLYAIEQALA
jgi:AcrR family transcriptional regulator